ncbi:MAG: hypothetical protein ACR2M1_00140, partial [Gemmatimonadaceae bacterium]
SGMNDVSEEKNGLFFFNSLADLATGQASSFTRILSASLRTSSRTGAAVSAGDARQPRSGLGIDCGVGLEGSRYGGPRRTQPLRRPSSSTLTYSRQRCT